MCRDDVGEHMQVKKGEHRPGGTHRARSRTVKGIQQTRQSSPGEEHWETGKVIWSQNTESPEHQARGQGNMEEL